MSTRVQQAKEDADADSQGKQFWNEAKATSEVDGRDATPTVSTEFLAQQEEAFFPDTQTSRLNQGSEFTKK